MKTTLEEAERLLNLPRAKDADQIVERAKGLALVALTKRVGRVASNLEEVATKLHSLVVEVTENKKTKDSLKRLGIK